jgi:hypothetical protein
MVQGNEMLVITQLRNYLNEPQGSFPFSHWPAVQLHCNFTPTPIFSRLACFMWCPSRPLLFIYLTIPCEEYTCECFVVHSSLSCYDCLYFRPKYFLQHCVLDYAQCMLLSIFAPIELFNGQTQACELAQVLQYWYSNEKRSAWRVIIYFLTHSVTVLRAASGSDGGGGGGGGGFSYKRIVTDPF